MAKYCCCENFYSVEDFKKGAKVKFRELPVRMSRELKLIVDEVMTIKSVLFRINQLGDLMVVVELDQLPGVYFSPSILSVININAKPVEKIKDNTFRSLIEMNNNLSAENSYLRNTLNHALNGNFED
jgi:hypothetical protein